MRTNTFQSLLRQFFLERLMNQQRVSPCTIESYRDTFRILLKYLNDAQGIKADDLALTDLNANAVIGFLNYLEQQRKNDNRTINNRLAAIKAFMAFVSYECPEYLDIVRKIKLIPFRKVEHKEVSYLSKTEIDALLGACQTSTSTGRRNYLMVLLLYNSGMRVSEMITLKGKDVIVTKGHCHIRISGKGRKERTVPLWEVTRKQLVAYLEEYQIKADDFLLSGRNVEHLTRSGVRYRLDCIVKKAALDCPSLKNRIISAHTLRHSTAMSLLQSGIDISTIAIWLGHESIETTHKYMVADLNLKEKALKKMHEPESSPMNVRFHASEELLQFLDTL